jgi:hypothetical protein
VRLGVADVELERFCEGANRLADLLLAEETVTQRVPSPRGCRALLDIRGEQRFDLLEPAVTDVAFELGDAPGIFRPRRGPGQCVEALFRDSRARV